VDIGDGQLYQLTSDGQDVAGFDAAGDVFVLTAVRPVTDSELYQSGGPAIPDMQAGAGASLFDLLYPARLQPHGIRSRHLWTIKDGKMSPVLDGGSPVSLTSPSFGEVLSLSPGGRYVVATSFAPHIPQAWESFEPAFKNSAIKIIADPPGTA